MKIKKYRSNEKLERKRACLEETITGSRVSGVSLGGRIICAKYVWNIGSKSGVRARQSLTSDRRRAYTSHSCGHLELAITSHPRPRTVSTWLLAAGLTSENLGPDLKHILRQSYDHFTIMPNLRSTYNGRLIYQRTYEKRSANSYVRFKWKIVRSSEIGIS